jgi:hypothetical protein
VVDRIGNTFTTGADADGTSVFVTNMSVGWRFGCRMLLISSRFLRLGSGLGRIDRRTPTMFGCSICRESRRALCATIAMYPATTLYGGHGTLLRFHAVTICDYGDILLSDQRVTKTNTDIRQSGV